MWFEELIRLSVFRMDQTSNTLSFAPFAAGIIAGANGTIVGHPFDTLKTRFQVGKLLTGSKMDLNLVQQLYRGIMPPLLTSGAIQSVNFFLYENFRKRLQSKANGKPIVEGDIAAIFVAGTMSGSVISLVSNPISMVKIRQQIVAADSIRKCVHDIYTTTGLTGFYRGWRTMYLLDASRGMYLAIYEVMKRTIADSAVQMRQYVNPDDVLPIVPTASITTTSQHANKSNEPLSTVKTTTNIGSVPSSGSLLLFAPNSTSTRMLAASLTGIISWIIIFPIDVVRVRLHLDFDRIKYTNWRDCVKKTYAENGIRSFFRGLTYTLIRAGPVSAASLTTYEHSKDLFERWEI